MSTAAIIIVAFICNTFVDYKKRSYTDPEARMFEARAKARQAKYEYKLAKLEQGAEEETKHDKSTVIPSP